MPSPVKNKAYKKAQQETKRQLPALDPQPGFVIAEQRSRATKLCFRDPDRCCEARPDRSGLRAGGYGTRVLPFKFASH